MITVKWKAIFDRFGHKTCVIMDFQGDDLEDIHKQIWEFTETKEDNDFDLVSSNIFEIT